MKSWPYWMANVLSVSGAGLYAQTNWRWRMTAPPKGDDPGVPLNAAKTAGEQCRSYGAASAMRVPGRMAKTAIGKALRRRAEICCQEGAGSRGAGR